MRRMWWLAAMAVMVVGSSAFAQDANAAIAADDCGIPSMRGKATIEISGKADVAVWASSVEGHGAILPITGRGFDRKSQNITEFGTDSADLTFTVRPNENSYLTVTLDLDDAWNSNDGFEQDDFLKEMYFTFENICNTGFGFKFGKMPVPFGYDKDELLVSPYLDGYGESFFNRNMNGAWYQEDSDYSTGFFDARSTYMDNLFGIMPYYNWSDKLLIEASLFQGVRDVNNQRRRSNDDLFFKSMALKVTWTPIENLILQASGMTMYNDSAKNALGKRFDERMWAISLSADYTFQVACRDLNIFAEWQHAWNPASGLGFDGSGRLGFNNNISYLDDSKSDDIHFGLSYKLTDRLKIFAQGEWMRQRQGRTNILPVNYEQELWRAVAAVQYELSSGIILEGGWQHEWLTMKRRGDSILFPGVKYGSKRKYDANTFFAGIRYTF